MQTKVKTLLALKQRGYAKMTETDFDKLLRYEKSFPFSRSPLSPKVFACELDAMSIDNTEDLYKLRDKLVDDCKGVEGRRIDYFSRRDNWDGSTSYSLVPYYSDDSALEYLCHGTNGLAISTFALTFVLAAISGVGELGILLAPEACAGVVNTIEDVTRLCAETTVATGAFSFLLKRQLVVKTWKCLTGRNRILKRRKAHLDHVDSLIMIIKSIKWAE